MSVEAQHQSGLDDVVKFIQESSASSSKTESDRDLEVIASQQNITITFIITTFPECTNGITIEVWYYLAY